jgi:hypothetical protein
MKRSTFLAAACMFFALCLDSAADEGMYTFENPPKKIWKQKYGFSPDQAWLERAMKASVRFNNGGSGSFVSGDGLVLTNHHVGFDCIQKISTPEKDFVAEGFVAGSRGDEVPCPDLELNVLVSFKDVTARVTKAMKAARDDAEAARARKKVTADIEKECSDETGLRCNVVTLYGGGQYMLYRYRKHTDVRLVFAPEQRIAFFGGDFDNFTYPRFDLDMALFHVYENDKPFHPEHYFGWSKNGAAEDELVFVVGNPGTTGRQLTVAQLEFQRDIRTPNRLRSFGRVLAKLKAYAAESAEKERQAKHWIFGFENAVKAYDGFDKGLRDPAVFAKKVKEEEALKEAVKKRPETFEKVKYSWKRIAGAQEEHARFHETWYVLSALQERTELLRRALMIVQMVEEKKKPNEERYEEFRDSSLESAELDLYSTAPVYEGLEKVLIQNGLEEAAEVLGADHAYVKLLLDGRTPEAAAAAALKGTRIYDPEIRKDLVKKGGKMSMAKWHKHLLKLGDPMIMLALRLDPVLRDLRKRYEENVESVEEQEAQKISEARFEVYGTDVPPDATFTLRIAFGVVKGYEAEGTIVPHETNFYGLYGRSAAFDNKPPFDLPGRWVKNRDSLDLSTPLNFVSTADITGGNSGSPVINRAGEIVGLIFDGNIDSLVLRYIFTEEKARAVAVHSSGIREALKKIYGAGEVAAELGAGPSD